MSAIPEHITIVSVEEPDGDVAEVTKEDVEEKTEEEITTPWRVILYDDDIHTFEEVITQIRKATGCSLARAETLTWKVHNDGKATVYEGDFEDCLKIDGVLKEIQLVTEIKG